eukprot:3011850-Pyramimonas_sp.AAC.1
MGGSARQRGVSLVYPQRARRQRGSNGQERAAACRILGRSPQAATGSNLTNPGHAHTDHEAATGGNVADLRHTPHGARGDNDAAKRRQRAATRRVLGIAPQVATGGTGRQRGESSA